MVEDNSISMFSHLINNKDLTQEICTSAKVPKKLIEVQNKSYAVIWIEDSIWADINNALVEAVAQGAQSITIRSNKFNSEIIPLLLDFKLLSEINRPTISIEMGRKRIRT
jgi:hypothetical protein